MRATLAPATKDLSVQIDPTLHGYVKLLASLLQATVKPGERKPKLKDLVEKASWRLVEENKTRLEAALGAPIEIPKAEEPGS